MNELIINNRAYIHTHIYIYYIKRQLSAFVDLRCLKSAKNLSLAALFL